MDPWTVTLSNSEAATLIDLAVLREKSNRKRGIEDQQFDRKRDGLTKEREGMAGEYALAKLFGLFFDFHVVEDARKNPPHDFWTPNGTIDAKTTSHQLGNLMVDQKKIIPSKTCDWYALLHCAWDDPAIRPTVRFDGFCHRLGVFDEMKNIKGWWKWGCLRQHLLPPHEFPELLGVTLQPQFDPAWLAPESASAIPKSRS